MTTMNFKMSIVTPGSIRTMYLNVGSVYSDSLMTERFREEDAETIEQYIENAELGEKLELKDKAKRDIVFERIS